MLDETSIRLLELAWKVIAGACAAAWIIVPVFFKWVKPHWEEWRYRKLVPSQRGASGLVRLIKLLGKIQDQLSYTQNEIVAKIRHDLGQVEWNVWTEALPYAAIYSSKEKERCSALRNLSQVSGLESIKRASTIIKGIVVNPGTSKNVRRVAEAALKELEERQKMEEDKGE